jgi:hypothetical protein
LIQIYGVILTNSLANTALLLFQVKAAFINICDKGNCLSEIYMDCFVIRYFLIVFIRIFDRAVFYTDSTASTFVLSNIPGLLNQCYVEVSCLPFYTLNFSIGEDLYIGMPADLDQFRCEYSHRAVIRGKGLVKLGHMTPDAWRFLNKVDPEPGSGKIERGLNTADPSTDNHYVSEITVSKTLTKLFDVCF